MIDNQPKKTKAYIAGVNLNDPNFDYYMTELANLTEANNMEVVDKVFKTQNQLSPELTSVSAKLTKSEQWRKV